MVFLLFWSRDGRRPQYVWCGLPFVSAALSGLVLIDPSLFPGLWGLRLGAGFAMLTYGAGWQTARVLNDRKPSILAAAGPSMAWLAISVALDIKMDGPLHTASATARILIVAAYNALSAWEFRRRPSLQLPSGAVLFSVFAGYAAMELLRSPFTGLLPAPLGAAPTTPWSVVLFNLLVVIQALLVCVFTIAFLRERVAAEHYRMALLDSLTGVGNRRAFEMWMAAFAKQTASHPSLALLVLDIDRFKTINDTHGHGVGDKVIARAAEVAKKTLRPRDVVFRIGGEEFACLLEDITRQEAMAIAQRLRMTFETEARMVEDVAVAATISVGVAIGRAQVAAPAALLASADAALYEAKRAGRNRVIAAE